MARYQTNNLLGIGLMLLASFEYTALVWATLIGYVIWLDIPSADVWIGAAIIISCGLYVIHRESLRHRAQAGGRVE